MKQPTAPSHDLSGDEKIYPDLSKDGQNYRLQKISKIEKQLILEKDARKASYKSINAESTSQTELILH